VHRIDAAYCYACRTFRALPVCVLGTTLSWRLAILDANRSSLTDMSLGADIYVRATKYCVLNGGHAHWRYD